MHDTIGAILTCTGWDVTWENSQLELRRVRKILCVSCAKTNTEEARTAQFLLNNLIDESNDVCFLDRGSLCQDQFVQIRTFCYSVGILLGTEVVSLFVQTNQACVYI